MWERRVCGGGLIALMFESLKGQSQTFTLELLNGMNRFAEVCGLILCEVLDSHSIFLHFLFPSLTERLVIVFHGQQPQKFIFQLF